MIGAILGDIVGSIYEFDNIKTKEFELFDKECIFTDDSVMTIAIAETLMQYDKCCIFFIAEKEEEPCVFSGTLMDHCSGFTPTPLPTF